MLVTDWKVSNNPYRCGSDELRDTIRPPTHYVLLVQGTRTIFVFWPEVGVGGWSVRQ